MKIVSYLFCGVDYMTTTISCRDTVTGQYDIPYNVHHIQSDICNMSQEKFERPRNFHILFMT